MVAFDAVGCYSRLEHHQWVIRSRHPQNCKIYRNSFCGPDTTINYRVTLTVSRRSAHINIDGGNNKSTITVYIRLIMT